jgi:hypothetical protein
MCGVWVTPGDRRGTRRIIVGKQERKTSLGGLEVDGIIILKCVSKTPITVAARSTVACWGCRFRSPPETWMSVSCEEEVYATTDHSSREVLPSTVCLVLRNFIQETSAQQACWSMGRKSSTTRKGAWTRMIWPRIGEGDGLLWMRR